MWKWVMNGVDTPYTVPTTLTPVVLKTPCHLLSNNEHTVVKKIMNVFTTTWNCCYERRSTTSLLIFVSADNIRRVVFDCLTKLWWWFWSANILVVYSLWNWCGREGKVDSFTAWNRVCQRYHLNHHQGQHKQNFIQPQNNINIKTNINNIFTI